jgi:branched-subunit amino acid transport protein
VALGLGFPEGHVDVSPHNLRLIAGLVAIVAALLLRGSTIGTIGIGMAALWALQWLT